MCVIAAMFKQFMFNSSPDTMKYFVLQDLEIASSPLDTEHAMMMANFGRRFARGIGLILSSSRHVIANFLAPYSSSGVVALLFIIYYTNRHRFLLLLRVYSISYHLFYARI